jgi:folate-dependent phosphoribosylglycinamide formyltransferase PurN
MRTLLICHEDATLDREGLVRWLGSFSRFAGTVVIREPGGRLRKRIAREIARVGFLRFLDVLAFRVYHRLMRAAGDRQWETRELARLRSCFPDRPDAPERVVASPNSGEAQAFIREQQPDLVIARCKTLLNERIFSIPRLGTYVMHPGICPEYRNAHGCFWAMATGDHANVGMTMLRIDKGVDTGPVFGYFRVEADARESHVVTQHRVVFEHLDAIRDQLLKIEAGTASPIDAAGRKSATWGQPWLSALVRMRARSEVRTDKANVRSLKSEVKPASDFELHPSDFL